MLRKLTATVLAVVLALSLAVPAMAADEEYTYVAFGDSIAAGFGLSDYVLETDDTNMSYVKLLAGDAALYDFSQSGTNTAELAQLLKDPEVLAAVAKANLITISVGGNDLILPLLQALLPDKNIQTLQIDRIFETLQEGEDVLAAAGELGLDDISKLTPVVMQVVGKLGDITDATKANISASLAAIKAANPTATVVIQTVYNPYRGSALLGAFSTYLDAIFTTLNSKISAAAAENNVLVADVFTAFAPYGSALLASANGETFYDPHPNYNGHVVIAKTIENTVTAAGAALPSGRAPLADALFTDVTAASPYLEAVQKVFEKGLMNGVGDNKFNALGTLTRGMVVTVLSRINPDDADYTGDKSFSDVEQGAWYESAVKWAATEGIVNGFDDGTFRPFDLVTREQLAALLYRYFGSPAVEAELTAADGDKAGSWAADALAWALEKGVLSLDDEGKINPKDYASRGDTAVGVCAAVAAVEQVLSAAEEAPVEGAPAA